MSSSARWWNRTPRNYAGDEWSARSTLRAERATGAREGLAGTARTGPCSGIVKHPGAFAEYLVLPDSNLHIVPGDISDEQATFTEPVAAACEILDQVAIGPGAEVAVLGDGKLGILIAQVLLAHGARVVHFGRHPEKLAITRAWGATTKLNGDSNGAFGHVVEATGSAAGLEQAVAMTRPRGTLIMKSTVHGSVSIDTAPIIVNEITMVGSRCGRFEPALRLLGDGLISVDALVSARYSLADAAPAFAHAARPGTLKILFTRI